MIGSVSASITSGAINRSFVNWRYANPMILRTFQILAVVFMAFIVFLHFGQTAVAEVFEARWREILFGLVGVTAGWLFAVTQSLRPVVAIFAAAAFFVIASLEEPSAASFLAALDGITSRVLTGVDVLGRG